MTDRGRATSTGAVFQPGRLALNGRGRYARCWRGTARRYGAGDSLEVP